MYFFNMCKNIKNSLCETGGVFKFNENCVTN